MADAGSISFKLLGDTKQFRDSLSKAQGAMTKLKDSMMSVKGALAGVGLVAFGSKLVGLARTQIEAETKLAGAIKATGSAIDAEKIKAYAASLQKVTTFGDEATISSAALLTSFKLTEDQIMTLLPGIQDFAAATGRDLGMAAQLFGRLVASGEADLTRYGIALTDAEKALFKTGTQTERAALATELLSSRFGGMAQELAKTDFGKFDQAMNDLGDAGEELGKYLIPALARIAKFFTEIAKWAMRGLQVMATFTSEGITGMKRLAEEVRNGAWDDAPVGPQSTLAKKLSAGVADATTTGVKKGLKKAEAEFEFNIEVATGDFDLGFDFKDSGDLITGEVGGAKDKILDMSLLDFFNGAGKAADASMSLSEQLFFDADLAEKNAKLKQAIAEQEKRQHESLVDTIGGLLAPALGKMGGTLNALFKKDFVGAGMEFLGQAIAASDSAKELSEAFDGVVEAAAAIIDAFQPLWQLVAAFVNQISGMLNGLAGLFGGGSKKAIDEEVEARRKSAAAIRAEATSERSSKAMRSLFDQGVTVQQLIDKGYVDAAEQYSDWLQSQADDFAVDAASYALALESLPLPEFDPSMLENGFAGVSEAVEIASTRKEWTQGLDEATDAVDEIAALLGGGADTLKETTDAMNEQLTNVPQGLKVALLSFQNATADVATPAMSGTGAGPAPTTTQSLVEEAAGAAPPPIHVAGDIVVNGVTDSAAVVEQIVSESNYASVANAGPFAQSGSGGRSGFSIPGYRP